MKWNKFKSVVKNLARKLKNPLKKAAKAALPGAIGMMTSRSSKGRKRHARRMAKAGFSSLARSGMSAVSKRI